MDYIFRLPLVDFDITNQDEITKNWTWIQKAIEYSSESMHREIVGCDYGELSSKLKLKIHKFLLRGRYRATPFGYWAAVGLGEWSNKSSLTISTASSILPTKKSEFHYINETPVDFHIFYVLNPTLCVLPNSYRYYAYQPSNQRWNCRMLDRNRILDTVTEYAREHKKLNFESFADFFEFHNREKIASIWSSIVKTGLLQPSKPGKEFSTAAAKDKKRTDIVLDHPIHLSDKIQSKLSTLRDEIGALFTPVYNQALSDFIQWFEDEFDDRQVLLSDVVNHPGFSMDKLIFLPKGSDEGSSVGPLDQKRWEGVESLDLSEHFPPMKLEKELDLDVVFRVLEKDEITIENFVCNRPFVYSGRFSRDEKVRDYLTTSVLQGIRENDSYIYAELLSFESEKANYISETGSFLPWRICLFTQTDDPLILGPSAIYIGLSEGRLELFDLNLEKRIIPVVQHPLNPSQISHPLTRLVCEIAHQSSRKFLVYSAPEFTVPSYIPRIMWKDQILQGKRWTLASGHYHSADELDSYLETGGLPHPLLAGTHDLELLLHWRSKDDLQVLWEELKRRGKLYLFEVPWFGKSSFISKNGKQQYPQVISKIQVAEPTSFPVQHINPQNLMDPEWVYLQLGIAEQQVSSFLRKCLPTLIREIPDSFLPLKWYYLIYTSPYCQIRIRFNLPPRVQSDFKNWLIPKLVDLGGAFLVKTRDFYPEFSKYSFASFGSSATLFHFESSLMMGKSGNAEDGLIQQDVHTRLAAVLELWLGIVAILSFPEILQREFKTYLDQLPLESLKLVKSAKHPGDTNLLLAHFKSSYIEVMKNHSWFSDSSQSSVLLSNHLHMLTNRVFHLEAPAHESQLVYWLYKALSRRIFSADGE